MWCTKVLIETALYAVLLPREEEPASTVRHAMSTYMQRTALPSTMLETMVLEIANLFVFFLVLWAILFTNKFHLHYDNYMQYSIVFKFVYADIANSIYVKCSFTLRFIGWKELQSQCTIAYGQCKIFVWLEYNSCLVIRVKKSFYLCDIVQILDSYFKPK